MIVDRSDFVQLSEKELFEYHKTSYLNKDHVRRAFFKIRVKNPYLMSLGNIAKDEKRAALFLAGLFLPKPLFIAENDTQKRFVLLNEVIEKIVDCVDFKMKHILCEYIPLKEKIWEEQLFGQVFWTAQDGQPFIAFFNDDDSQKATVFISDKDIEKKKMDQWVPVKYPSQYQVYSKPCLYDYNINRPIQVMYPKKIFLSLQIRWQFSPQWVSINRQNNQARAVSAIMDYDTRSVRLFEQNGDFFEEIREYSIPQNLFFNYFSFLLVSPNYRVICLVNSKDAAIFSSDNTNERKNFFRLSYDDANWLSKRIGEPKKLSLWLCIKRLLFQSYTYTMRFISLVLLKLTNIVS